MTPQMRGLMLQIALSEPGEFEAVLQDAERRRQGAASPDNPYGSFLPNPHYYRGVAGYGTPCITCGQGPDEHEMNANHEPVPDHLPQHKGCAPGCTYEGCDLAEHQIALAAHPLDGAQ